MHMKAQSQNGFILVATLWVMVIVAIAAGYFANRVALSIELAQQSKQNTRALIDMAGARAEILYRLATISTTEYGLGRGDSSISLDNRPYATLGNTILQLQDARGLLNLNYPDGERLHRLLGQLGIPAQRRSHMIDTLRDYIDNDNLHRLNGAEAQAYLALNLPPPSNNYLVTPWEARRIIGWRDAPELWQDGRLLDLITTSQTGGLNPNTAPAEILRTLTDISEEHVNAIINQRKVAPILHFGQLASIAPITTQQLEDVIVLRPSNTIRITQYAPGAAWAVQYSITLTPNDDAAPWKTDYFSRVNAIQPDASHMGATPLPPHPGTAPEGPPGM